MEALINRAMGEFLPDKKREFFMEREDKLSIEDKWQLLPLILSSDEKSFDISRYPWTHFKELIKLRNDFVHPKHKRVAYYRAKTITTWIPLSWKEIPSDMNVKEKDVVYRQTQIPRDPYSILINHVDQAKQIVDDTIKELDDLLGGLLLRNNWLRNDSMDLVYPQGSTIKDMEQAFQKENKG